MDMDDKFNHANIHEEFNKFRICTYGETECKAPDMYH